MTTRKKHKRTAAWRITKWALIVAVVALLGVFAFKPRPVEIDIGSVLRASMMVTVDDDGETRVRDRYLISAPIAGTLLRPKLRAGDIIHRGDVLAIINPANPTLLDPRTRTQAEAIVKAAEASVESMRKRYDASKAVAEQAEKAFRRNLELHRESIIADAAFEEAERVYLAAKHSMEAAEAAVDGARFELEQAKAALEFSDADSSASGEHFVIESPIDGHVFRVLEESSRTVQVGKPLLRIGNPDALEMKIDVLSQDAVKIEPGQKVIVEQWGGNRPLSGQVRVVEPSAYTKVSALGVDEQRVDVLADFIEPGAAEQIGDGFRIEGRIVIWESDDALQVPVGALFRSGNDWAVYQVTATGTTELVNVRIGMSNGETAQVLNGLNEGDQVVLHPGDRVESGTPVRQR